MKLILLAAAFCTLTSSAFSNTRANKVHRSVQAVESNHSNLPADLLQSHLSPELTMSHISLSENSDGIDLIRWGSHAKRAPAPATTIEDVLKATYKSPQVKILPSMKALGSKDETEAMCLALNIYHEARGSNDDDQIGVGFVTLNRARLLAGKVFGNTICKVVGQRLAKGANPQFSWLMQSTASLVPFEEEAWQKAEFTAIRLYTNHCTADSDDCWKDITKGALFFWNPTIAKMGSWMRMGSDYTKLGGHMYMAVASSSLH